MTLELDGLAGAEREEDLQQLAVAIGLHRMPLIP
jgi:hypothetical protein